MILSTPSAATRRWTGWPLPAVLAWLACWTLFAVTRPWFGDAAALALATGLGAALAWRQTGPWRRAWVALGFPASLLASGAALPAWTWLLPLALLASAYPLRAWRDAPLFPTPARALDTLAGALPLPGGASVLDAGCGLGHGLRALHAAWPKAQLHGIEWSWPLAWVTRLRCPWARVRQGDMWGRSWAPFNLVYVFQRPESMARAWGKACSEMRPGSWLVSLEFVVPGRAPDLCLPAAAGRTVRAWQLPMRDKAQSAGAGADNPG